MFVSFQNTQSAKHVLAVCRTRYGTHHDIVDIASIGVGGNDNESHQMLHYNIPRQSR
jgi:hypothetical protein